MKKQYLIMVVPVLLLAAACKDPAADKPKAEVTAAAPTPENAAPPPAEKTPGKQTIELTPANTTLGFVGSKVTGKHEGTFEKLSGTVSFEGTTPSTAQIEVTIDTGSVKTDSEKLDGHLKSPDFFDVEKFPTATFKSTGVAAGGESNATHTVAGDLTLHGVTKSIRFPATISVSGGKVDVKSEFAINRKDFGIVYPGMPDDLIRDDVVIQIAIGAPLPG